MLAALLAIAALLVLGAAQGASVARADDVVASGGGSAIAASAEETLRKGDRGSAVRRFQRRHGLVADGIVGPLTRAKLGLARFASTDVRHPPADGADEAVSTSPVKLPRVLREIAECESGGNPRAVSSNGMYRGKFQFSRATWKAIGGRGNDPAKASEAHQDRMALKLYRQRGVSPWPACSARAAS